MFSKVRAQASGKCFGAFSILANSSLNSTSATGVPGFRVGRRASTAIARNPAYKKLEPSDIDFFRTVVGVDFVLTEKDDIKPYNTDWMRKWSGDAPVVLRPNTTQQVSQLMAYCSANKIAVVPQGGNTGLVGGSVPVHDEIILSLGRMNQVTTFDDVQGIVTAEAGMILENLTSFLEERGFTAPLDLGAKGTCQIGGNVATHAGGLRFVRYGSLHGTVLGVEAVLADGRIIDVLTTLRKDNTGYDLKQLFIGSEGTLGVITKVALLCPPKPRAVEVMYLGMPSYARVLEVMRLARFHLQEIISATEFQDSAALALVQKHIPNAHSPLEGAVAADAAAGGATAHRFYMLIETAGGSAEHNRAKIDSFLEALFTKFGDEVDGTIAETDAQAKALWKLREGVPESAGKEGYVYKYDISLPVAQMYEFVERTRERLADVPEASACGYGHLGDGNLHLNVMVPKHSQEVVDLLEPWLFEELRKVRGSVSAEHGLGQVKNRFMGFSKSPESIALMHQLRDLMDPQRILNPYKVTSDSGYVGIDVLPLHK